MEATLSPKKRTVPMEVLVLGLCRTGTLSMKIALEELGYKNVYHMSSAFGHDSHPALWLKAMEKKYPRDPALAGKARFSTAEWDEILGDYSGVTDIPCAIFAAELIAAYPGAKIILTTRSTPSWHRSMLRTIHALQSSPYTSFLLRFSSPHNRALSHLTDVIIERYFLSSIPAFGEKVFEEHNAKVREEGKRSCREVLEFRAEEGWGPLCCYLGKAVPEGSFPSVNDERRWRAWAGLGWSWSWFAIGGVAIAVILGVVMREHMM